MADNSNPSFMADLTFARWNCITREVEFQGTTVYSFADLISERDSMGAQGWNLDRQERII